MEEDFILKEIEEQLKDINLSSDNLVCFYYKHEHSLSEKATTWYNRTKNESNSNILYKLCCFSKMFFDSLPLPISLKEKTVFTSEKNEKLYSLKINACLLAKTFLEVLDKNKLTNSDITINKEIITNFTSRVVNSASKSLPFVFENRIIFDEFSKIIDT